ncbi:MAG: ABC transporter substrate-binding protein [Clostridia bacterium]|nr:ABC transporter substrate-binding protein [Clostridia bacterium]
MKKFFSLCVLLALSLSLGACSGTPFVGIDSSALEPFVIGGIGPLTEEQGAYGRSIFRGAQIAVTEINATGGVNGFRLVLNFQDSKGDPKTAATLYAKLMDNDM